MVTYIQTLLKSLSLQNCRIVPPEPSFSANFTYTILKLLIQKETQHKVSVTLILFHAIIRKARIIAFWVRQVKEWLFS